MKSSLSSKTARKVDRPSIKLAGSARRGSTSKPTKERKKSQIDIAIAKELAPAAAIALLDRTEKTPDSLPPALDILAAGVSRAGDDDKIRVQLAFDGGEILPVEMSVQAGKALATGLAEELGTKPKR